MGGLGNQLFQIFATISYAIKTKNKIQFLNLKTLGTGTTTIRNTYWNTFFSKLKPFLIEELPELIYKIYEVEFLYKELPLHEMINKDILISGYFQSYKYFEENYGIICRMLSIGKMKDQIISKLSIKDEFIADTISMHFRIGDYKNAQEYHPLTTYEYYEKALEHIQKSKPNKIFTIIYFFEEQDIEDVLLIIHKLQDKFSLFTFIQREKELADWEQLLFMSCCHHNIIANSSFSWWSAYFNFWQDKIVCYPEIWFGKSAKHNTRDLFPPEWICI
jgi:hypothetical protein